MKNTKKKFLIVSLSLMFYSFHENLAFATDYDDCVLKNMKGISSNFAMIEVMRLCKEKTTPQTCRKDNLNKFTEILIKEKANNNINEINKLNYEILKSEQYLTNIEKKLKKNLINDENKSQDKARITLDINLDELYDENYSIKEKINKNKKRLEKILNVSENEAYNFCLNYCKNTNIIIRTFGECKID